GEAEGLNGAFQTLEQVDRHQCLKTFLPVYLTELSTTTGHLGVIQLFVLLQTAGQNVADRGVYSEFEQRELLENLVEAGGTAHLGQRAVIGQALEPFWEVTDVLGVVEGLNVLARTGNGDTVQ